MSPMKARSGMVNSSSARTRGTTQHVHRIETEGTHGVDFLSRIFIEPISAVNALPERPATIMAVEQDADFTQEDDGDEVDREDIRRRSGEAASRPAAR